MPNRLSPLFEVKLIVQNNAHFYQLGEDEKWLPGVTTVLKQINKPALIQWGVNMACDNFKDYLLTNSLDRPLTKEEIAKAYLEGKNIYKKKAEQAADVGSRVHKAIDLINMGEKPVLDEDIKPAVEGFLSWKAQETLTIELGDTKIGSKVFGYGGSLDMIGFDKNGDAVILDVKTTKKRKDMDHGIYDEAAFQMAAYCQAFKETYGVHVKNCYGLWLNKEKPEFKAVKILDVNVAFEGFLAALKLHQLSKTILY